MPANETQVQLAPAAGAGVGKLLADALLSDPDFLPSMKAALMGGLKATRSYYDKGQGGQVVEQDSRVQVQTVALLLAHMEGEPIKRIVHQHLGGEGGAVDPMAAMRESPALMDAVEKTLAKARWRTSGNQAHKRPAKQVAAELVEVD
jgi:hypothetical protein